MERRAWQWCGLVVLVGLAGFGLAGCREAIVGPEDPPLDLSPDVEGVYAGAFVGELARLGAPDHVVRDTFQLAFTVRRLDVEYVYEGELARGGAAPAYLYACGSGQLTLSRERRTRLDCVQASMAGETLVLRVDGRFDPAYDELMGAVSDVHGIDGAEYPIRLRRASR